MLPHTPGARKAQKPRPKVRVSASVRASVDRAVRRALSRRFGFRYDEKPGWLIERLLVCWLQSSREYQEWSIIAGAYPATWSGLDRKQNVARLAQDIKRLQSHQKPTAAGTTIGSAAAGNSGHPDILRRMTMEIGGCGWTVEIVSSKSALLGNFGWVVDADTRSIRISTMANMRTFDDAVRHTELEHPKGGDRHAV